MGCIFQIKGTLSQHILFIDATLNMYFTFLSRLFYLRKEWNQMLP